MDSSLAERHASFSGTYSFAEDAPSSQREKRESNLRGHCRGIPIAVKRAKGIYVEDVEGRVFIDGVAAAGTLALGHNHAVVTEAIERALHGELPMHTLALPASIEDTFVEELVGMLPGELRRRARIQICGPSDTDAVESALRRVTAGAGRTTLLAFHGAYHGESRGWLDPSGNWAPKQALGDASVGVQLLPFPYDYRCPFALGGSASEAAGLQYIRSLLMHPERSASPPAGLIVEAIQGEGGVIPAPDGWLRALRAICTWAGIPMILDELQTGLGQTGRFFAFEHAGVVPDVIILSKAIGGGLPLSAIVYRDGLDGSPPRAHADTLQGNPLAMAAGIATLRFIRREQLEKHAATVGQRLSNQLHEIGRDSSIIGEVRGRGLILGIEVVDPGGFRDSMDHFPPSPELASAIQRNCLQRGLILELGGHCGSIVRLSPPLIITEHEVDRVAAVFGDAVRAVERFPRRGADVRASLDCTKN